MQYLSSFRTIITEFFQKGHTRSIAAKKNIAASLIIKGTSVVINLALVPLTINYINPTQYGIWLTLSSIILWFSFFDIGFGNGLRNRFAEAKAVGDFNRAKIYISTTYAVLFLMFSTLWVIFFVINFLLDWTKILNTPADMARELSILALMVFSFFCLQMILKTISTIIVADQKPALAGFFDMVGQLLSLIIIFILTKTTEGSLLILGLVLGLVPVLVLVLSSILLFGSRYRNFTPGFRYVQFKYAIDIMSLGIKFFFIQVSGIIIFQTSNIVITQVIGPDSVTVYNIAYKYFFAVGMLFGIVMSPFWSAFTDAYAMKDFLWISATVRKLERLWILIIPLILMMLVGSNFLYKIWIGTAVRIPFMVSVAMALYVIFHTRFNMYILLINGIGKVKVQLFVNILVCIVFIPLAIASTRHWGLTGLILLSTLIAIIHSVVGQLQINWLINGRAKGIWNK